METLDPDLYAYVTGVGRQARAGIWGVGGLGQPVHGGVGCRLACA